MTCQDHLDALIAAAYPHSPGGEWLRSTWLSDLVEGGASVEKVEASHGAPELKLPADFAQLHGHLADCSACRQSFARMSRLALALCKLTPLVAPLELEGAVVAAMNAGHRQERAVRYVEGLPRLVAPAALDAAVARNLSMDPPVVSNSVGPNFADGEDWVMDPEGHRAPPELDGMVEQLLTEPYGLLAARLARHLRRVPAPASLAGRVGARLAENGDDHSDGGEAGSRGSGRRRSGPLDWNRGRRVALAVAASVTLVAGLFSLWGGSSAGVSTQVADSDFLRELVSRDDLSNLAKAHLIAERGYTFELQSVAMTARDPEGRPRIDLSGMDSRVGSDTQLMYLIGELTSDILTVGVVVQ